MLNTVLEISFRSTPEYKACEVIELPESIDKNAAGFPFQKNSQYLDLFNYYLLKLKNGIIQKIKLRHQIPKPQCGEIDMSLGFKNCFTTFLPLFIGGIFGLILLFTEKCGIFKCSKNSEILSENNLTLSEMSQLLKYQNHKIESLEKCLKQSQKINQQLKFKFETHLKSLNDHSQVEKLKDIMISDIEQELNLNSCQK